MSIKIAINGVGRIGKAIIRQIFESEKNEKNFFTLFSSKANIELVGINSTGSIEQTIHSIKYDSIHGQFNYPIKADGNDIIINNTRIKYFSSRDLSHLSWKDLNVDVVMECTGVFRDASARGHIDSGAKKVIISSPATNIDNTIILGVNENSLNPQDKLLSIGSCTTNCLLPIVHILDKEYGIENGFFTTVHSYTNDQSILDQRHKDIRRSRASSLSMIPTSTGASKTVGEILPSLKGKISGKAIRVPTPNVSFLDLQCNLTREATESQLKTIFANYAKSSMKGILSITDEKLVSIDFNHSNYSSIIDSELIKTKDNSVSISSWYDNEWAFASRMIDLAMKISG